MPPQTPLQPEAPKPNHSKIWVLIILGFLLIAINAWFLFQNLEREQITAHQDLTASTTNEFADWQTYRNEEYGFEFKYPSGWAISQKTNQNVKEFWFEAPTNDPEFLKTGITQSPAGVISVYTMAEYDIYLQQCHDQVNNGSESSSCYAIYIPIGQNKTHVFTFENLDRLGNLPKDFGPLQHETSAKIAETFKLISASTPEAVDVSDWKTYKSVHCKYTFNYPPNWVINAGLNETMGGETVTLDSPTMAARKINNSVLEYPGDLLVFCDSNPQGLDVKDFYNGSKGELLFDNSTEDKEIVINGIKIYRTYPTTGIVANEVIIVPAEGYFIRIENNGANEFIDQILSTFKFTK